MKPLMTVRPEIFVGVFSLNLGAARLSNMRPSPPFRRLLYPSSVWFFSLILLAGWSGCGPATSDHAPNSQPHASLGAPSVSQQNRSSLHNSFTPTANPVPLAIRSASNYAPTALAREEPPPLPEHLVLPTWIAQALDAPEVSVRLQALDMWAQQGTQASLDPLVVALDDEDDDVRAKAMAIIEQNWAIEESESEAEK